MQRLNKPGNRTPATIDANREAHFRQMQQLGHIPSEYTSWDEVESRFLDLTVREGLSDKKAAEVMGVDYRNVLGKGYLSINESSQGKVRGLDMRVLREDIKPDEEVVLRQTLGDDGFKRYQRWRELQWGDAKPSKKDADIIREFSGKDQSQFLSTKVEADQVRDRLHEAFGNGGRGAQVHRGHGGSALEGAGTGANNLWPEWGPLNVGHGSAPRYDHDVMANNNMMIKGMAGNTQGLTSRSPVNTTELFGYYNDLLDREGLNINPVAYHGTGLAADESLRELQRPEITGKLNSVGNPQISAPVEPGRVSQDSIEWRNRRLYEAEQQIAADAVRRGANPDTAQALARQRVQELAFNQSGLADTTQSHGGPVRQVSPPRRPPVQIGTVDSGPKVDSAGRPQVDRAGQVRRDTRPLFRQADAIPSPSVTRGRTAAAIATREPVPAPRPPAPTPKPKPKPPTRPNKQLKVRGGTSGNRSTKARGSDRSAIMQINRMSGSAPDALSIHPGMSLPSQTLIQGI